MQLTWAFRIGAREVAALVGGGGKSTTLFRLADEIVAQGGRVITTTTTRIFAAQTQLAPAHLALSAPDRSAVAAALERQAHVLVTGAVEAASGKALGVPPAWIEEWLSLPGLSAILIEADGARMRPFKAPAEHEPVIPDFTSLVIPVIGADVFGQPLDEAHVHRPERVRALTGAEAGASVTPELAAAVLGHAQGGLKGAPPAARVMALINKVDRVEALAAAEVMAARLLDNPRFTAVALGRVKDAADPVRAVHGRVAAVVLAAGRSERMGRVKQTLPWGGSTLVAEAVRRVQAAGCVEVLVVTGAARAEVEAAVAGLNVRCVFNPDFAASEMAGSLQAGLRALPENVGAALVALADQPRLETATARAVCQRWRETQAEWVAPFYHGQRGHPLLLDRSLWPAVFSLPIDANPRQALQAARRVERVEVDSPAVVEDIDTAADYERALRL